MMNFVGPWLFIAVAVGIGLAIGEPLYGGLEASDRPGVGRAFLLGAAIIGLALHVPLAIDGQITHCSFVIVALAGVAAWFWNLYRFGRYGAGLAAVSLDSRFAAYRPVHDGRRADCHGRALRALDAHRL